MAQQGFSQGQVPAAYLKVLCADDATNAEDAAARFGLDAATLRDETRPVALSTYVRALELVGAPQAIAAQARLLEEPQLALWTRLLRRAASPEQAFELLGSEEVLGSASFSVTARAPGQIRGQLEVRHDPRLEEHALLAAARAAFLAQIPRLYGYQHVHSARDSREVTIAWRRARGLPWWSLAPSVLALVFGVYGDMRVAGIALLCVGVVLGSRAWVWQSERARAARALSVRGRVMERQLELREEAPAVAVGDFAGNVVAGLYRIGARMGTGASGVVYAAERITDGVPVAIKLLRAATAHDAVASDRLRREAEALGLAWHPNVVEVLDHGMLPDGTSYLVMEALHGESLADRLAEGPLPPQHVLAIGVELAAALAAVHAAGVVHRDVKPDNVFLLAPDAAAEVRLKLLDFGIARVEWEELRLTRSGGPLGTPGFMAPEQERGEDPAPAADVYSLGALLRVAGAQGALLALSERMLADEPTARPSLREVQLELGKLCSDAEVVGTLVE